MIIQRAKLTWELSPEIPPRQVPAFVEEVARLGGDFLVYRNEYISVEGVIQRRILYEKYIRDADNYLARKQTAYTTALIQRIIISAGEAFCLYCSALTASREIDIQIEFPAIFNEHPKFLRYFEEGIKQMEAQLTLASD